MKILYYSWDIKKENNYPDALSREGINVKITSDEEEVLNKIESGSIDLLIFDSTNVMNYKKLFQYLSNDKNKVLSIAITKLTNNFLIEEALSFGLNDYITDNLTPKQFVAKIKAFLYLITKQKHYSGNTILKVQDLELNPYTREAKRGELEVILTNKEYKLLELLMLNKNKVVSRTMISEKVWNKDENDEKNIGDVYITFLRRKIDKGFSNKLIKTVRNIGYMIKD